MNPTGTEARVCADIAARQAKGTAKYGTTVQDNPLGLIQWLQHAYEECLDQAVYLKRAMELMQGVEAKCAETTLPIPSNPAELKDPHAELRKTWRKGHRWQFRYVDDVCWCDCAGKPLWDDNAQYRRHPEDKDAEPTTPSEVVKATFPNLADPHAALKAVYQPGMRWRNRSVRGGRPWSDYDGSESELPGWVPGVEYEIHPDDLPKSPVSSGKVTMYQQQADGTMQKVWEHQCKQPIPQPDADGWITVPDDCMEMPEGLKADDRVEVMFRNGNTNRGAPAISWFWGPGTGPSADFRIVAYRPHHQTR